MIENKFVTYNFISYICNINQKQKRFFTATKKLTKYIFLMNNSHDKCMSSSVHFEWLFLF